ncbi:MAG TPA: RHS repeat-associated core domain-containing protein [Verrucomicrobiae bacterium]
MRTQSYDDDAQLNSSLGYTSGGTPVASEQLGFGYGGGWNMTSRSVNGTPSSYIVNDLNQVTNAANVPCSYDQNGNRITSGQGSGTTQYTYDDENRLTRVSYSTAYRTDFTYDGLGRLRVRSEYTYYYGQWNVSSVTRYIYDGKRVIQERNQSNTPLVSYTRGRDLSGSLEGAGGVGGLLARSHGYSGGNWTTHSFYHADSNGNVTYMINSAQSMVASYEYDPYGRTISSSGSLAAANVYRFSSKELHLNSGLYYYLYRFYDPNTQRWINRDPLGERENYNLYTLAANSPVDHFDVFGLHGNPVSGPGGPVGGPEPPVSPPIIVPPYYNPGFWNGTGGNNCYNYALDQPTGDFRQPCGGFPTGSLEDCTSLKNKVFADGGRVPDNSGNCPAGTHKIRLWANGLPSGAGGDLHFYRQDCDGSWSNKPGVNPVGRVQNPSSYGSYQNCGDLCVANQPLRF